MAILASQTGCDGNEGKVNRNVIAKNIVKLVNVLEEETNGDEDHDKEGKRLSTAYEELNDLTKQLTATLEKGRILTKSINKSDGFQDLLTSSSYVTPRLSPPSSDYIPVPPPELESSYKLPSEVSLPPPPPGYDDYLHQLQEGYIPPSIKDPESSVSPSPVWVTVTTYTVPLQSEYHHSQDSHVYIPPTKITFPGDDVLAKPLDDHGLYSYKDDNKEDVYVVKHEKLQEYHLPETYELQQLEETTTEPPPVIDLLKYIPLFLVTTIAVAASIVFGTLIG